MGPGCSLGFTPASNSVHSLTAITQEPCTLLRVKRQTFEDIWKDERVTSVQATARSNGDAFTDNSSSSRSYTRSPDRNQCNSSNVTPLHLLKDIKVS